MLTLILAVSVAVVISFTCSLTEAALYAVPWSAIEKIRNDGRPVGEVLFRLRSNVEKPIAAILTLNTVANTAGSAVAGAAFWARKTVSLQISQTMGSSSLPCCVLSL